jgi:hypothetical protein
VLLALVNAHSLAWFWLTPNSGCKKTDRSKKIANNGSFAVIRSWEGELTCALHADEMNLIPLPGASIVWLQCEAR